MEDNDEVACNIFHEVDECLIKIESAEIGKQYFNSEDTEIEPVPVMEKYNMPKRRGRPRKRPLEQSSIMTKQHYSTMDSKLGLRKNRFRPIRPKPYPSGASLLRNKLSISPMLNTPTLQSKSLIVTVPSKDKIRYITTLDDSSKNDYINLDNDEIGSIKQTTKENKAEKVIENSNIIANNRGLRKIKTAPVCHKSSIELFFESMAQTVLNLPQEVQADIKMQICKIVTMAEIKYCGSQMKLKTD